MNIAALSVVKANHNLRLDASLAIASQTKQFSEQISEQFIKMVEHSTSPAPHPSLGHSVDVKI